MKKLWIGGIGILTVMALLLSFILIASAGNEKENAKDTSASQVELELYKEQVSRLEKELDELKETSYLEKQAYETRISDLELLLVVKNEVAEKTPIESNASYTYTVVGDKVTITGCIGEGEKLTVPGKIDGLSVTAIGREAFKNAKYSEIILPDGIEKIDWFAFSGCDSLEKIYIPASVNKIEYGAFDNAGRIVIACKNNSYAQRYAKSYGFGTEIN
jgi:hypothetical protein